MATTTPQLILRKPAGSDLVNVTSDISENMDKIDAASWKVLGFVQIVADHIGLSADGSVADIPGLSVAVTVGAARRIRVTGSGNLAGTNVNSVCSGIIREGALALALFGQYCTVISDTGQKAEGSVVLAPAAGVHTYKLSLQRPIGAGTVHLHAGPTTPAFILVEDIGPA